MTPDEVKGLKPGQECLIRATYKGPLSGDSYRFAVKAEEPIEDHDVWTTAENIHSVLPDPIKVGDRVMDKSGHGGIWQLRGIDGEFAWCWGETSQQHATLTLADLEHLNA